VMITPVTHLVPLAYIRRERMLPGTGQVLVSLNQHVNATDIVAEAAMTGQHLLLDIRKALNLRDSDDISKIIEYKSGENIEKGDILAQTGGMLPRVVRAPVNGKIVAIHRGLVILEHSNPKYEMAAAISGIVTEILPERGVMIESNGALIQGVWGNGRINQGLLRITDQPAEEELTPALLDISMRGAVVLASFVTKPETLETAARLPLRGLILSSMSANLIPQAQKLTFPIILLEGFGQIPMNQAAFQLLITNEKREVCLNSEWNPGRGEKPEIFIPLPAEGKPLQEYAELAAGKTVRVTVPPYSGQVATLVELLTGITTLSNGKQVKAARIRLNNGQTVVVPLANMDVLE